MTTTTKTTHDIFHEVCNNNNNNNNNNSNNNNNVGVYFHKQSQSDSEVMYFSLLVY